MGSELRFVASTLLTCLCGINKSVSHTQTEVWSGLSGSISGVLMFPQLLYSILVYL